MYSLSTCGLHPLPGGGSEITSPLSVSSCFVTLCIIFSVPHFSRGSFKLLFEDKVDAFKDCEVLSVLTLFCITNSDKVQICLPDIFKFFKDFNEVVVRKRQES